jgi:hypothetical protein
LRPAAYSRARQSAEAATWQLRHQLDNPSRVPAFCGKSATDWRRWQCLQVFMAAASFAISGASFWGATWEETGLGGAVRHD